MLKYDSSIPEKLYIEMPLGELWSGKYVKWEDYNEGLANMMSFYRLREFHMVFFKYFGSPNFKLKIFNECRVEIFYPFSCLSTNKFRVRRSFAIVGKMKVTDVEIDKLAATSSFSTLHNFIGLHDIVIGNHHLVEQLKYEV